MTIMASTKVARKSEVDMLVDSNLASIVCEIGRDIGDLFQQLRDTSDRRVERCLGSIFCRDECREVVLRLLQQQAWVADKHGLVMNGRSRGAVNTRIDVDLDKFHIFSIDEIRPAYASVIARLA